jgi:hypothetical protein
MEAAKNKQKERAMLAKMMFESDASDEADFSSNNPFMQTPENFEKVRIGGKGRTGASDFTKGKCAFTRPCTVGWKSQNQPLSGKGGNRTPL